MRAFTRPQLPLLLLAVVAILIAAAAGLHMALPLILAAGPIAAPRGVEAREKALAKLLEAKALSDEEGRVAPENERKFSALMAEFRKLDEAAAAAGAVDENTFLLAERMAHYNGAGEALRGMVFPSAGGSGGSTMGNGRRSSIHAGSWGATVVDSVTSRGGIFAGVVGGGSVPVAVPLRLQPVTIARRLRFLREVIPSEPAPNGRFAYMKQTVRTNNAAVVAVGAKKPTSVYTMVRTDDRVRTIAHLSEPIARQDISDAPMLQTFVDEELRYGLDLGLDSEAVNGDGTGEHLLGFLEQPAILTQAFDTGNLATCRSAITKLELTEVFPTAFVMNPTDWEITESEAMAQFAANPNQSTPIDAMVRRLFGLPVVVTNAIEQGTALLGDFAGSAQFHPTEEARVDWSENVYDPDAISEGVGATDFERNMIRFRAECRYGLEVSRPASFVAITLQAAG